MGHELQQALKTIWTEPRATIRNILDTNPKYMVLQLAALAGIANALGQASSNFLGDALSLYWILIISVVLGPVLGIIWMYIISYIVYWVGKLMGGKATRYDIRTVYAWSNIPILIVLALWVPQIILFQEELFTESTPRMDSNIGWFFIFIGFIVIEVILGVWSFIIYLVGLSEVQQFSKWKAFFNILLSGVPFILAAILLIIVVFIFAITGAWI